MVINNTLNIHLDKHYKIKAVEWVPDSKPKQMNLQYYRRLFSDLSKKDAKYALDLYF